MLPAPARIAAAPMANSRPSCRPAVPPPPVTGAPVGYDVLGDGDGDGLGLGLGLGLGEVDGLAEGDVEVLAEVLVLALVEEVDVDETVAVAEPPDGVNTDDGVDPDEQAETPTAPRRIKAPQPTAVSLTPRLTLRAGPAIAARTFIEPPSCGAFSLFPAAETGPRRKAWPASGCAGDHNAKPGGRHKRGMARSTAQY